MKKTFDIRTVLSATTGRLLTKPDRDGNGIGALYKLLGHMTNDEPFTHQLPRFFRECQPWLLRWFPFLTNHNELLEPHHGRWIGHRRQRGRCLERMMAIHGTQEGIELWIRSLKLPANLEVDQIPRDDHDVINPYDELVINKGTDEGIVLVGVESVAK